MYFWIIFSYIITAYKPQHHLIHALFVGVSTQPTNGCLEIANVINITLSYIDMSVSIRLNYCRIYIYIYI